MVSNTKMGADEVADLFNYHPDAVFYLIPEYRDQEICDFRVMFCNSAAEKCFGAPSVEVVGCCILQLERFSDEVKTIAFRQCLEVMEKGQLVEHSRYYPEEGKYISVRRTKVKGGVLNVVSDRTADYFLTQQKNAEAIGFNEILNNSLNGIAALTAVRDDDRFIVDFLITHCNEAARRKLNLPVDAAGKTLSEADPTFLYTGFFEMFKRTVDYGLPSRREIEADVGGRRVWVLMSLSKLGDGLVVNLTDISQTKGYEETIKLQANQLNSILDASFEGIAAMKAIRDHNEEIVDFVYIKTNQRFYDLLSGDRTDHIGRYLLQLYPYLKDTLFKNFVEVAETGTDYESIFKNVFLKQPRWFKVAVRRFTDDCIVAVYSDISDAIKSKHRLEESAKLLQKIINSVKVGIALIKPVFDDTGLSDFQIVLTNKTVYRHFSSTRKNIEKLLVSQLLPGYRNTEVLEVLKQTLASKTTANVKLFYDADGLCGWYEITASPLDENLVVTVRDFTALKKSIEEQEHLKKLNAFKDEFISIASHELKTPLTGVKAYLQLAERNIRSDDESSLFIRKANANVVKLERLVAELLDLSHINSGQIKYDRSEIDCVVWVEECVESIKKQWPQRTIVAKYKDQPQIEGDRDKLDQVLCNLLSNALKYSEADVRVVVRKEQDYACICVHDEGIGISESDMRGLFSRFYRANVSSAQYQGLGLGLYISQQIVEQHKGSITVHSKPGKGSTFCIQLPLN